MAGLGPASVGSERAGLTPGLVIRTPRLDLVAMTGPEIMAIREHDRSGRMWAPDYPAEGDVLIAELAVQALAAAAWPAPVGWAADGTPGPWAPLQMRWRFDGRAIGSAGFKHPPDARGTAEIGYGVVPSMRGQGVATEAVQGVIACAQRHQLCALTAETHVSNLASQQVLRNCGFGVESRGGTGLFCRLDLTTG